MMLPKTLEADFWQDFKQFEQERTMTLNQLESLGEALLDFTAIEDLLNCLESHQ